MEPIIDRGEVVLYCREDLHRLENYLTALSVGDEEYKPEGLTIRPRTTANQEEAKVEDYKPAEGLTMLEPDPKSEPADVPKITPEMPIKNQIIIKESIFDRKTHRYGQ